MTRLHKILAAWIYISSLAAVVAAYVVVSTTLGAYPKGFLATFGPRVPAASTAFAEQLPFYPPLLAGWAAATFLALVVAFRTPALADSRYFYTVLAAALNFCFAFFSALTLLVGYFMLPKLANGPF